MISTNTKSYLINALDAAPTILNSLLVDVSPDWYDQIVDADRFTLRQILAHLADWEEIFLTRLNRMVSEDNPVLQGFDEGKIAIDHDYNSLEPSFSVSWFTTGRRRLVEFARGLSESEFERPGVHTEFGRTSVADLLTHIAGHDIYHFKQIVEWKNRLADRASPVATSASTITSASRTELIRKEIPGSSKEAVLFLLSLPPGGSAPPHRHPGIGVGYVLEGIYESLYEGEDLRTFTEGDAIYDLATTPHLIARNGSPTKPVRFLMAFVVSKGEPTSGPM